MEIEQQSYNTGVEMGRLTQAVKNLSEKLEANTEMIGKLSSKVEELERTKITVSATFFAICATLSAVGGFIGVKVSALLGILKVAPPH